MHRNHTRTLLALLVLVIASLACTTNVQETFTKGIVTCRVKEAPEDFYDYVYLEYDCACQDGGDIEDTYRRAQLDRMSVEELESLCTYPPQIVLPALSTEPPTEELAPTEPPTDPVPLKPYLTGAFTTCDNVAGYVNFSIAEDAPAYDPATFKVTFNGYPVNCAPAANNPSVLTCNYPPPSYAPPAGVQVFIGEELVNEFDFNGGEICNPAPQPNTNDNNDNEGEQQPAPTEAPTEDPGGNG